MSCNIDTNSTVRIWRYVLSKVTQPLDGSATVSNVAGTVTAKISVQGGNAVVFNIGPLMFTQNLNNATINVSVLYGNVTVASFQLTGMNASANTQYILEVAFVH